MKNLFLALLGAILICTQHTFAADIATDIRHAADGPDTSNGGHFEIGLGLAYVNDSRLSVSDNVDGAVAFLSVGGSYRYKGLFLEMSQGTLDGFNLGYHLWNNQRWAVDMLGASINGVLNEDDDENYSELSESQRDNALIDRDTFYAGAGFRATGYFGNTILQYRLVSDIYDNNGIVSTLRLGQNWQHRNWNFHGVISADYASTKTSRYWYGVSENQATTRFPEYNVGSTMSYTAELGLSYPISEHFVFSSTARYTRFSNGVQDSPLTDGNDSALIFTSINYVF